MDLPVKEMFTTYFQTKGWYLSDRLFLGYSIHARESWDFREKPISYISEFCHWFPPQKNTIFLMLFDACWPGKKICKVVKKMFLCPHLGSPCMKVRENGIFQVVLRVHTFG